MSETILSNATIILEHEVLRGGALLLRDGRIAAVDSAPSGLAAAEDCAGDLLMPGIIDLHTDNLERQVMPRADARWPARSAYLAHDAQCAAAGVTTVFDALCVGKLSIDAEDRIRTYAEAVADLGPLAASGLFKAEHFLHLRCELPAEGVLDLAARGLDHPATRMLSLMDHTPGIGQYADLARFRSRRAANGESQAETEALIARLHESRDRLRGPNRRDLLSLVAGRPVVIASHDDETIAEVAENHADGITISEFPVRLAAARHARELGMTVIAGAPNIVRGGSHSGNVAVSELLAAGVVDAFASDYVPSALLEAVFAAEAQGLTLPRAVGLVTHGPADMAGLTDRGRIAVGQRADLLRVRRVGGLAAPVAVWRQGQRVA